MKAAILLQRMTSNGLKMVIIMQYHSKKNAIQCCFFGGREPESLIKSPFKQKSLEIQAGPNNTCYFIQSDKNEGHQIIGVSLSKYKPSRADASNWESPVLNVLFTQRTDIIAWQMRHDHPISESGDYQVQLIILDADRNYLLLGQRKTKFSSRNTSVEKFDNPMQIV